jgi:hypothetical protein
MASLIFLVLVILFIMFLFGIFSVSGGKTQPSPARRSQFRPTNERKVSYTTQARNAMQRAGYQGGTSYVSVTDIGLLAYRNPDEPKLLRYGDVMVDTAYVRPFVELWLPYVARGPVRFELTDSQDRLRYADESQYELERGPNTLLPGTWLPLQDKTPGTGEWKLRVMAGSTLLAVHPFGWQAVGGGEIQRYAASDGEISPSLQQALHAHSQQPVSLDDLLAGQEE